jgi:hypothetical protein
MKGLKPMVGAGIACLSLGVLVPVVPAGARAPAHRLQVAVMIAGKRAVRPKALDFMEVRHLVWSSWGPTNAIGKGEQTYCPTGTNVRCGTSPTTINLFNPVNTSDGWLFDQVTYEDKGSGGKPVAPGTSLGGPDLGLTWSWPASVIIFPTAGNVTGNYLWTGQVGNPDDGLLWLQVVQDGHTVSGNIEEDEQQSPFSYADDFSGVAFDGTVSITIRGANSFYNVPPTAVLTFSHGDLTESEGSFALMTFVPSDVDAYGDALGEVLHGISPSDIVHAGGATEHP